MHIGYVGIPDTLTRVLRCGCTIDAHGFIDPVTGKIVKHLKKRHLLSACGSFKVCMPCVWTRQLSGPRSDVFRHCSQHLGMDAMTFHTSNSLLLARSPKVLPQAEWLRDAVPVDSEESRMDSLSADRYG